MDTSSTYERYTGLSRLKLFFALSRTPHGVLDMATPAFAALLCLGAMPPVKVVLLGLITAFSGYTAVYALNDLVDYRSDRRKLQEGRLHSSDHYLDAVIVRHPIALGLLGFRAGLFWMGAWALLALIGAYALNPVCVAIFLGGCLLEAAYCLMWSTSHLRTIVSGAVKTSGGIAAVFAVDPHPSLPFVLLLFLLLFFWEIGGQNVPADWADIEEDARFRAKTIPVRFGPDMANRIILGSLILAVTLSVLIFPFSPVDIDLSSAGVVLLAGLYLLLFPAYRLFTEKERDQAMSLFNKASYYPLALLVLLTVKLTV